MADHTLFNSLFNANSTKFKFFLVLFLCAGNVPVCHCGMCWSSMSRKGFCKDLILTNVSKQQCCKLKSENTAWTEEDLNDGALFFWRVLNDGVPCAPCKETCEDVKCERGMKCAIKKGRPKCVCAPKCAKREKKGPVCGTDGRSYKSICRLKMRACRSKQALGVDYVGLCQNSCKDVHCPMGKYCVQDQHLKAHCVKCRFFCAGKKGRSEEQKFCGADGRTYRSICHLREAACRKGKAIPIAYQGRCKKNADCVKVRCKSNHKCLIHPETRLPQCVFCSECFKNGLVGGAFDLDLGPVCGSNNQTYESWCSMIQDSCREGYVIETKFLGNCSRVQRIDSFMNAVLSH